MVKNYQHRSTTNPSIKLVTHLYGRSRLLSAEGATSQALLLSNQLYDTGLSEVLKNRHPSYGASRWLVAIVRRKLEAAEELTRRLLRTAITHRSQLALLPGWQVKLSVIVRQLRDIAGGEAR